MMMEENAKARATVYPLCPEKSSFFRPKISIQAPLFNL
jgi:hypothetical protein